MKLGNNEYVYDIECNGLLAEATKIHCLSIGWKDKNGNIQTKSTTDYDKMRDFFNNKSITRVGHNITFYDERIITKLLGIETLNSKNQIIDTLALSWYLFPERLKHGLGKWGEDLGINKVKISDWSNLTSEEYIFRCEEDVKINLKLWENCKNLLNLIYDNNQSEIIRLLEYLQFKLDCIREQEDTKIKLDIPHIKSTLAKFKEEKESKEVALKSVMPKVVIKNVKTYKNVIVLENGEFYERGDMMFEHYFREGYRPKLEYTVEKIKGHEEPNPNSSDQKKSWLFGLGWNPTTFEYKKNEDGTQRKIPQIASDKKDGSVCDSVKVLYIKEPTLEVLEGLSVLSHRIGVLESFLKNQVNGYMEASMAGLTNTLRIKHSNIVNLPSIAKKYGKEIRSCLIASEGETLCGSDMVSLEDSTKQHYMYFHDPKYVMEMRTPGFDPHIDIGVISGIITKEEEIFFKNFKDGDDKKKYTEIKDKRHKAKTTNFSSIYGVGKEKLARSLNIKLRDAEKLLESYWKRNIAVRTVAEKAIVKTINNKKWIYNPVSRFWYSLRYEKDRFSTLNQGLGVYCFDTFIKHVREKGIKISLQMHDEILFRLEDTKKVKEKTTDNLNKSIEEANKELKLNVPLGISMDFGKSYSHVH